MPFKGIHRDSWRKVREKEGHWTGCTPVVLQIELQSIEQEGAKSAWTAFEDVKSGDRYPTLMGHVKAYCSDARSLAEDKICCFRISEDVSFSCRGKTQSDCLIKPVGRNPLCSPT